MNQIDELISAIIKCEEGMDERTFWPCHPAQAEAYFSDLIAVELLTKFRKDRKKFAQALDKVPVDILRFHLLDAGIVGLKVVRKYGPLKIETKEILAFIGELLSSIERRVKSNPLCADGKNLLLSNAEVEKKVGLVLPPSKLITWLNVAAEAYTWAVYFDAYRDAGFIIHGPYVTSLGQIVVRDYYDLQPPFSKNEKVPTTLTVAMIYDTKFSCHFDFANHVVYGENHLEALRGFTISSNQNIEQLESLFENSRRKLVEKVESWPPEEIIWQSAVRYWYLFKNFFAYYGQPADPPREINKRIKTLGLKYWHKYVPGEKRRSMDRHRRFYDSRNDFLG